MTKSKDRRNFLKLLLAGTAVAVSTTSAVAGQEISNNSPNSNKDNTDEKIKMLSEDGTLVEIDRAVFERMKTGKKAANKEIREFVKPLKK